MTIVDLASRRPKPKLPETPITAAGKRLTEIMAVIAGFGNRPNIDFVDALTSDGGRSILFRVWFVDRVSILGQDAPLIVAAKFPEPIDLQDFDGTKVVDEFLAAS